MKIIFITGVSGTMGSEALKQIAQTGAFRCRVLLRPKKANIKLAKKLQKNENIEVLFGDIQNYEDCLAGVKDADYVLHCAAIIPPAADHNHDAAFRTNWLGTQNLLNAVVENGQIEKTKFVYIGTVAEYGNRTFKHPWGRVGDPLLPSAFDMYAASKVKAERAVIESPLCWVSLRQSGILYDEVLFNNMNDGLMFHTCWNTPIEWATARTSGLLLKNLVEKDTNGTLRSDFWKKVYNIGNGKDARVTGFETLDRGFKMMGRSAEEIFRPEWNASRNFHCMWFADSHILNSYLDFQHEGFEAFFSKLEKKLWYFKLGKPFPRLVQRFSIMPLLNTNNAPVFWVTHNLKKRVDAFFGSPEAYNAIPRSWKKFPLLCKNQNPETGAELDYAALKDEALLAANNMLLNHGYDETKKPDELDIEDMQQAAAFRGGKCNSTTMTRGDMYRPLQWQCHNGHHFSATPYLVLKTGHWCPECCSVPPWNFGELAKHIPFYAQVWYDDHTADETESYSAEDARDIFAYEAGSSNTQRG
ncbi:NAD(P)-dependent oxidoreductase [Treponema vincentii]|uniref:NAD-dependent epimerase/dehydratase family protein n=1 Tax=Treponema vincentii TaxID=69710 RepID=UPI001BB02CC6|nr:NAD(P)-dependent oxidoreductase [Treponema vincentii]QUY17610.1 NAD(P)-dependent oxidoreductase [Treponema vincentii]